MREFEPSFGLIPKYSGMLPGDNLVVSVSGGRTSGYLAKLLKDQCGGMFNLFFVFANTGQEKEQTLIFLKQLEEEFGLGIVWVEAVVNPERQKGTTHKIINFDTASREGEPFEAVIKKYGIANKAFPHCTRELKARTIKSYIRTLDIKCKIAIGIRGDEYRRVKNNKDVVYPLADWWPTDKVYVNSWWEGQSFNLQLKEHQGNCSWCWKKALSKHIRLIKENPEIFNFPRRMEKDHSMAGPAREPQVFFREHRSTEDLFKLAGQSLEGLDLDTDDGCSESCEMYEMG